MQEPVKSVKGVGEKRQKEEDRVCKKKQAIEGCEGNQEKGGERQGDCERNMGGALIGIRLPVREGEEVSLREHSDGKGRTFTKPGGDREAFREKRRGLERGSRKSVPRMANVPHTKNNVN